MRPKKAHTQTKNRLLRFEDDLDHLLSTSNFHTMEELFRSRAFKRITLRLGRRPRENDKKSPLRLDAFYKQAKDRCTGNVNSRAFRSCGKAFGKPSKKKVTKPRAVADEILAKPNTRLKNQDKLVSRSYSHKSQLPLGNPGKAQKESIELEEQFAPEEDQKPKGLININHSTCYALSGWQLLSNIDLLYQKLSEIPPLQLDKIGLSVKCYEFLVAKKFGDQHATNATFKIVLNALGDLLPNWKDLNVLQDADEYLEDLFGQLEQECSLLGIDLCASVFGCEVECPRCTLQQSSQGVVKRISLQAQMVKTSSEILSEILLDKMSSCTACSNPCFVTSLPRNIVSKINRHNDDMSAIDGAKLTVEGEVDLEFLDLSGKYKLCGAILFHERNDSVNHYNAVILHPNSSCWYEVDDMDVQKISQPAAFMLINKRGYIMHYTLAARP